MSALPQNDLLRAVQARRPFRVLAHLVRRRLVGVELPHLLPVPLPNLLLAWPDGPGARTHTHTHTHKLHKQQRNASCVSPARRQHLAAAARRIRAPRSAAQHVTRRRGPTRAPERRHRAPFCSTPVCPPHPRPRCSGKGPSRSAFQKRPFPRGRAPLLLAGQTRASARPPTDWQAPALHSCAPCPRPRFRSLLIRFVVECPSTPRTAQCQPMRGDTGRQPRSCCRGSWSTGARAWGCTRWRRGARRTGGRCGGTSAGTGALQRVQAATGWCRRRRTWG